MASLTTVQVHETYHHPDAGATLPRITWADPEPYLCPYPGNCTTSHSKPHKCIGIQLLYSNGNWHPTQDHVLHLSPDSNVQDRLINAISTAFDIVITPGLENLIRVCDNFSPLPLDRPLRYSDINATTGNFLVVHLLPKIVNFRIKHNRNHNDHGYQLHVEISAHDSILAIQHAIHKQLNLHESKTIQFQDRHHNPIDPTWSAFPHSPDPNVETMQPMRCLVVEGVLPAIPVPADSDYEGTVQYNWQDVNSDYCVQAFIRPGTNDVDPPNTQHRSIECGHVDYLAFNEFANKVALRLARLSKRTPGNRELARRLLWCIVLNRNEGLSRNAEIAEIMTGDLDIAIRHMDRFNEKYPDGVDEDHEDYDHIVEQGEEAEALLLPNAAEGTDRDHLNRAQLEDLLLIQHIYADTYHRDRIRAQLGHDYP
ncbi:hypothetical protein FKW77_003533 [Venturia effusa]|uniref:Uncharacterized protein n=1 Tax=Venturia effusa TaxID=50376 RepID=A0A517L8Z6_9PEZI|nr:hypothetical protein FKW77_003533 [Venturia effusa]